MADIKTIRDLLTFSLDTYGKNNAFYIRNKEYYDSIKYSQLGMDTFSLASSFINKGFSGGRISIIGENSYSWVVTYLAAVCAGAVIIPIDKELQPNEITKLVSDSESLALIYSESYVSTIEDAVNTLKGVSYFVIGENSSKFNHQTVGELILNGSQSAENNFQSMFDIELDLNAVCSIVFTSGTTGSSKGVMLSHNNLLSNVKSCHEFIRFEGNRFSLLPMHHTYEFTLGVLFSIYQGCAISINNSVKYISQNLQIFAPTDLIVVPLVAETLYNSIWNNIRQSGKERSVLMMIKISNKLLKIGIDIRKIVFKKIHKALGGEVVNIFCGGAHVDADIARGYIDFGFNFFIGYGITECSPLVTANMSLNASKMASCGRKISCCDVKIDNPDENCEGEILVKGESVMLGYLNDKKATDEAFQDGWYKTGDIGRFDKDGYLYITGRIKNIIILKNGKNVYPEEIEGYIYKIPYVKEVLVYPSSDKTGGEITLCAEIFPNKERGEMDNITDINNYIKNEINKLNSDISYYKRIVDIKFRDVEFNKTTSKKIKRNI